MPRKQNSWAAIDPVPYSSLPSSSKPRGNATTARVLVIKEKGTVIPKSSRKGKQKAESPSASTLPLSSAPPQDEAIPAAARPASTAAAASQVLSGGPSIARSKAEFPALPAPPPKPNNRFNSNQSTAWGSGNIQESSSTANDADPSLAGGKKGKKNKGQVLMRFG